MTSLSVSLALRMQPVDPRRGSSWSSNSCISVPTTIAVWWIGAAARTGFTDIRLRNGGRDEREQERERANEVLSYTS